MDTNIHPVYISESWKMSHGLNQLLLGVSCWSYSNTYGLSVNRVNISLIIIINVVSQN